MPRKATSAAKPAPSASLDLAGFTGPQIADMVIAGDVPESSAIKFVGDRAQRKLVKAIEKARSQA